MEKVLRKFSLSVFILLFSFIVAHSQSVVKGVVYDENETSLPGVNIAIKGTINGTITNLDGEFDIEVSEGQILQFSFIGYSVKEILFSYASKYRFYKLKPLFPKFLIRYFRKINKK